MRHFQNDHSSKKFHRRRGMAVVEFALVVPVLITLLLGIVEFGLLVRDNLTLANAAREGARSGSLGAKQDQIRTRVTSAAAPLNLTTAQGGNIIIEQSVDNGATYTLPLADLASNNAVPIGSLLRVTAINRHQSLTGFFPFVNNKIMRGSATFRKE